MNKKGKSKGTTYRYERRNEKTDRGFKVECDRPFDPELLDKFNRWVDGEDVGGHKESE